MLLLGLWHDTLEFARRVTSFTHVSCNEHLLKEELISCSSFWGTSIYSVFFFRGSYSEVIAIIFGFLTFRFGIIFWSCSYFLGNITALLSTCFFSKLQLAHVGTIVGGGYSVFELEQFFTLRFVCQELWFLLLSLDVSFQEL